MKGRATAILLMLSLVPLLVVSAAVAADDILIRLPGADPLRAREWPWKCCDNLLPCRESFPPQCTCRDVAEECVAGCKECVAVDSGHVCNDYFLGPPSGALPPRCKGA